jgi:hypothetical protein
MPDRAETKECPYCKEEIKPDAVKCKHCGSRLAPERPSHGGICPYCKEQVHPEAIKCKNCGSWIGASATDRREGCGCCGGLQQADPLRMIMRRRADGPRDPIGCRDCLDRVGFWQCMAQCSDPILHPGGPDEWCIAYCYGLAAECQDGPCAPRFGGGRGPRI